MEEPLYGIEIQKDGEEYLGKIYSGKNGLKEFKNNKIHSLLRDITYDIRLSLGDLIEKSDNIFNIKEETE